MKLSMRRKLALILPLLLIVLVTIRFVLIKPETVLADSLFNFNEGYGGSVRDSSGAVTGTITGATWRTDDLCFDGKCLYFDGSDWISFGDEATYDFAAATDWTVQFWFRHVPASAAEVIVQKYNGTDGGYRIQMESDGDISFGVDDDNVSFPTDNIVSTAATYDDNQWHFVSAVKDGTTGIYLYIDNVLVASNTSLTETGTLVNGATFYVGDSSGVDGGDEYIGFLDELKVYTATARTQAEINADYAGGTPDRGTTASFGPDNSWLSNGLVGYWKMDDNVSGASQTITDASGNGKNGTTNSGGAGMDCTTGGKFGYDCNFDGTSDYVTVSSFSNITSYPFTFNAWVTTLTSSDTIVSLGDTSDGNTYFELISASGATAVPRLDLNNNGVSSDTTDGTTDLDSISGWHMVTGIFLSDTHRQIYVNGVLENDARNETSVLLSGSVNSIRIGASATSGVGGNLTGNVDEVRVYNRALSPVEVAKLYNWAPGPVGYWKMDENTGTSSTFDSSTNGNTGTLNGSMTNSDWVPGKLGSSLDFDGSNDYVNIPYTSTTDINSNLSISFWWKPATTWDTSSSTSDHGIMSKATTGTSDSENDWSFFLFGAGTPNGNDDDGRMRFGTYGGNIQTTTSTWNANQWYHIAVSYTDTNTAYIYVNGIVDNYNNDYAPGAIDGTTNNDLSVGRGIWYDGSAQTEYMNGVVDDIRIYNYARTPAQIIEDMNGGHPAPGSPVGSATMWWKCDEGYGSTANDSGTTGNYDGSFSSAGWTNSGKFGKACTITGGYWKYISAGDVGFLDGVSQMTTSMWLNSSALDTGREIFSKSTQSTNNLFNIRTDDTNSDELRVYVASSTSDTSNYLTTTNLDLVQSSWAHIVVVYDGTATAADRIKVYKDGILKTGSVTGTIPTSTTTGSTSNLTLGDRSDNPNNALQGAFYDDIKIYLLAMTADQVKAEYNRGSGQQLGALSTNYNAGTITASNSDTDSYCPPGQGSACTGPIGHWKLDENTGSSVYDSSENDVTGTLTGTTTKYLPGKSGSGVYFKTDNSDLVTFSSTNISATSGTISLWYKPDDAMTSSGSKQLLGFGNGASNDFYLSADTSNFYFGINAGSDDWVQIASATMANYWIAGNWMHIEVTYDISADDVYVYLNGTLVASDLAMSWSGSWTPPSTWYLGADGSGGNGYVAADGVIDDVRIYNYARTPAQIAWDYNRGKPVGWWKMDESSWNGTAGEVKDASGNALHGVRSGNATTTTGKYNNGGTFDGTDDYVEIANNSVLNPSTLTVCAWVKRSGAGDGQSYQNIIDKQVWDDTGYLLAFEPETSTVQWRVLTTNSGSTYDIDVTVSDNTLWHHYCGSFDGTTSRLYIDGVSAGSLSATMTTNTSQLRFGTGNDLSGDYQGLIDDVRIYNYPLTSRQIQAVMNEGATIKF